MNREFIFDASGQKIGFRCRVPLTEIFGKDNLICNKLCRTARGLKLHLRRVRRLASDLQKILLFTTMWNYQAKPEKIEQWPPGQP